MYIIYRFMLNILIFPSGSGVAKEIYDSLKYIRNITLFGGEGNDNNFTNFLFNNAIFNIPMLKDEELLINHLNTIVKENKINYIFPAYDIIHWFLSKHRNRIDCKVLVSDFETCDICISKTKTYNLLKDIIDVPNFEKEVDGVNYPCFIKPDDGCGARDSYKVNNSEELEFYKKKVKNYTLCEYLPSNEYTIDCFTNKEGKLIFCKGRERKKTIAGMSVYTIESNIDFTSYGEKINKILKFNGIWFFQMKYDKNDKLKLLECAPRIAGAMSLYRNKGINFSNLMIRQFEGDLIEEILFNNYTIECYKTYENKYRTNLNYSSVFVDLDDTIVIKDQVNIELIRLLYQELNKKKNIFLITRNIDPLKVLNNYKISESIFNEIIIVPKDKKKSEFIKKDSIFIDDSFQERFDVYKSNNIHVFNLDMVETLLNTKY